MKVPHPFVGQFFLFILLAVFQNAIFAQSGYPFHGFNHRFDIQKYTLEIDLYNCYRPPYPKKFTAKETISVRIDTVSDQFQLNAVNSSVGIISVGLAAVGFSHLHDTLTIFLDRVYQKGETFNIQIIYYHKNVDDHAFFAGEGFVFTDCPPEGARKWFPCLDKPSDKASWDLNAKVPMEVRLGSNGRLADSTIIADTIFYHWVSDIPVATYLITISSKENYLIQKSYYPRKAIYALSLIHI